MHYSCSQENVYLKCISPYRVSQKMDWIKSYISNFSQFHCISILLDTLYGENTLGIMVYMYLIQKAPKRLHLKKEKKILGKQFLALVGLFFQKKWGTNKIKSVSAYPWNVKWILLFSNFDFHILSPPPSYVHFIFSCLCTSLIRLYYQTMAGNMHDFFLVINT